MTVGDTNRLRLLSIHADEVLSFRFGTDAEAASWRPLARDGADLPTALRAPTLAKIRMGPGETADFTYVPSRPGEMTVEVWIDGGMRVVVPVVVKPRGSKR